MTPHMGEMGRLTGKKVSELQKDRIAAVRELAAETGAVCLLKDACTFSAAWYVVPIHGPITTISHQSRSFAKSSPQSSIASGSIVCSGIRFSSAVTIFTIPMPTAKAPDALR